MARPELRFTVSSTVSPSLKATAPAGFAPATVAVNVTDCPLVIVVAEAVSAVEVVASACEPTVSVTS